MLGTFTERISFTKRNFLKQNSNLQFLFPYELSRERSKRRRSTIIWSKRVQEEMTEKFLMLLQQGKEHGVSYKNKLAGIILGVFEETFQIDDFYEDETDDDIHPEEDVGVSQILSTRVEK